jgi:S-adenosylmethionine hydrolase
LDKNDITHDVHPQNISQARRVVQRSCRWFPAGSIHVVVVDPGVGSSRRGLLIKSEEHFYIGPDNGVFSDLYTGSHQIVELTNERLQLDKVSAVFHGRDIFAPAAACLASGHDLYSFGQTVNDPVVLSTRQVQSDPGGGLIVPIIGEDRFGNILLGIKAEELEAMTGFQVLIFEESLLSHCACYADAKDSITPITLFGSDGSLEIAVKNGSAGKWWRNMLGTEPSGCTVQIIPASAVG